MREVARAQLIVNGRTMPSGSSAIRIGRNPDADVRYDDAVVSRDHGVIEPGAAGWTYRDTSTRGTFRDGQPVKEIAISGPLSLRLGNATTGPELKLDVAAAGVASGSDSIVIAGRQFAASASPITVGRGRQSDVVIDDPRISRSHLVVTWADGHWTAADTSTRGTFLDGQRISQMPITGPIKLRLGDPSAGPELAIQPGQAPAVRPRLDSKSSVFDLGALSAVVSPAAEQPLRIGRAAGNDLVIDDLKVSRFHAELRPSGTGHELVDLGSHNGTFINGARISRATVNEGDVIGIGGSVFRFSGGKLEAYVDKGQAWLVGQGLSVWTSDRRQILRDISFALPPSSFLAVVGPSGAGKTTLLGALTGFAPAEEGTVWYGGRDVYASYEELRQSMGFVPQTDILHTELTVQAALRYAAALRFPPDVDAAARDARVHEVMSDLGLAERSNVRIEKLSGGQRKRTSVALELLTKPSLLFLDEPTSGLDPANEEQVVELLRELAAGGRVVVVSTHSIATLRRADWVLFLGPGGRLAYFGRPDDALAYFARTTGATDFPGVFRALEQAPDADWAARFKADPGYEANVRRPLVDAEARAQARRRPQLAPPAGPGWFRQFQILVRRYLAVFAADPRNVALTALQAPFFALLFLFVFPQPVFTCPEAQNATILIWLLVVGATWLGASNSIREIVKELPIYRRERAVGLSLSAYLASKIGVLSAITLLQTAAMVVIVFAWQKLPTEASNSTCQYVIDANRGSALLGSAHLELILGIGLAGIAAMALGLLVSAIVTRADKAATILPYILIVQTVLSQPFVSQSTLRIPGYFTSASWGVSAAASTLDLNRLRSETEQARGLMADVLELPPAERPAELLALSSQTSAAKEREIVANGGYDADKHPFWQQNAGAWLVDIGALAALAVLALLIAGWVLQRRDPLLIDPRREQVRVRAGPARAAPVTRV